MITERAAGLVARVSVRRARAAAGTMAAAPEKPASGRFREDRDGPVQRDELTLPAGRKTVTAVTAGGVRFRLRAVLNCPACGSQCWFMDTDHPDDRADYSRDPDIWQTAAGPGPEYPSGTGWQQEEKVK